MTQLDNPMAEFFDRIGQRAIKSDSSWWYEVQPGVLLSFPYHNLIDPPQSELDDLIKQYKLKAIRFPTPLTSYGVVNHLELNTDKDYDLAKLEREARRQTRRGLEQCTLEPIDFNYLEKHGLELNRQTAGRQERDMVYTDPHFWHTYCQAGEKTQGVGAWGVMVDGQLGTYLVAVEHNGWWNWLLTNSDTSLLKKRTSNVLFYQATKDYFQQHPDNKICYGLGSLEDVSNLDRFKINMRVEMVTIKQRLVFNPKLSAAFKLTPEWGLKCLNKLFPKNYTVRKASAMIRLNRTQTTALPPE